MSFRIPKSKIRVVRPTQKRKVAAPRSRGERAPVAVSRALMIRDPVVQNGRDSVRIVHSEFVSDVVGSTLFSAVGFAVNPALSQTFAWLSSVALRYERYSFKKLCFHYEPRCSTATAGTIILALDYDAADSAPESKQDVLSYHNKADSAAWQSCKTFVDGPVARNRGSLFTRAGALGAGVDIKTYDLGNLYVCASGHADATVCGELYVDYEVELMIPQVQNSLLAGGFTASAGLAAGALIGTDLAANSILANLIDVTATSASTLTFNQDWTGTLSMYVLGTGMSGNPADTGTAAFSLVSTAVYNAAATAGRWFATVRARRGQTLVLGITATTVTGVQWYFAPAGL